jgi:2,4-dienoyl-CoA reductase-like NADH-dependent reductase (Old Yellow Enzyme family)
MVDGRASSRTAFSHQSAAVGGRGLDPIFEPLVFRNLTVKNRVFRSSISGRIDNYNGSGTQARVNWEERFARGGVGGIISAHVPVDVRGRILPNYAHIDDDDKIPFWRRVGERVHDHDCAFILQLSHGGRQRDGAGVENAGNRGLSSTGKPDSFHGFPCQAMSHQEIRAVGEQFAQGARRAREAGLDGVELHACNGYLFTQFLSSAINDRSDEYGGPLENRARFLLEVIAAVRRVVGQDFHLQVKISAVDHNDAFLPWDKPGNRLADSVRVCGWVEEAGADAVHVSTGSFFPHPRNPAGDFPIGTGVDSYDTMLSSGERTLRNYLLFRFPPTQPVTRWLWKRTLPPSPEGLNLAAAAQIRQQLTIPVLCTGGFQTGSYVRRAIADGLCDGVTIARPLLANPNLVQQWAQGSDVPDRPCSYCNRCLFHVLEDPLGCYDVRRYDGDHDRMIRELMAFYEPDGFQAPTAPP